MKTLILILSLYPLCLIASSGPQGCDSYYAVAPGDICNFILEYLGLTLDEYQSYYPGVTCDSAYAGELLCVYSCSLYYYPAQGDSCDTITPYVGNSFDQLQSLNIDLKCSEIQTGQAWCVQDCFRFYTIAQGDTCDSIVQNNYISLDQLYTLNPTLNCDNLTVGGGLCASGYDFSSTTKVVGVYAVPGLDNTDQTGGVDNTGYTGVNDPNWGTDNYYSNYATGVAVVDGVISIDGEVIDPYSHRLN